MPFLSWSPIQSPAIPVGVRWILIITGIAYVLQVLPGPTRIITAYGALSTDAVVLYGQWWRVGTYALLHDPLAPFHLIFNMLALFMFGGELEQLWQTRRFVFFYGGCAVASGLCSLIMPHTVIIGASGAILGLLTAYAWYFPSRTILMFFIFPMPVRFAVLLIGAISLMFSFGGSIGGVAHVTHLAGIVVAMVYLKFFADGKFTLPHFSFWGRRNAFVVPTKNHDKQGSTYFEDVIDPVLKKISAKGIDSLSEKERDLLQRYSKTKNRSV